MNVAEKAVVTWPQVIAIVAGIVVPLGTLGVVGYLKLAARLIRIESRDEAEELGRAKLEEGKLARRELELIRHCDGRQASCPAHAEWVAWQADSKVQTPKGG